MLHAPVVSMWLLNIVTATTCSVSAALSVSSYTRMALHELTLLLLSCHWHAAILSVFAKHK